DLQPVGLAGQRRQRVIGAEDVGGAVDQEDMVALLGRAGSDGGSGSGFGGLGFRCWHGPNVVRPVRVGNGRGIAWDKSGLTAPAAARACLWARARTALGARTGR